MTFESQELLHIKDIYLAEAMAYTEKPFRDASLELVEQGVPRDDRVHEELMRLAKLASYQKGANYLLTTLANIRYVSKLLPEPTDQIEAVNKFEPYQPEELPMFYPEVEGESDHQLSEKYVNPDTAKIAGILATGSSLTVSYMMQESGLKDGVVRTILWKYEKMGLITSSNWKTGVGRGRPRRIYDRTDKFVQEFEKEPAWQRIAELRTLARKLNTSENRARDIAVAMANFIV